MQDMEIQNGAQADGARIADGGFRQRRPRRRRLRPGTLHPQHPHAAAADEPHELGQDVPVARSRATSISSPRGMQTNQRWGTPQPITIRDKEFGAVRLRGFGIYSCRLTDPRTFYTKVSGTRDSLPRRRPRRPAPQHDHRPHVGRVRRKPGALPRHGRQPDRAGAAHRRASQARLSPTSASTLDTFVVENLSLPDELQKLLDQRIGMNMVGDMGTLHAVPGGAVACRSPRRTKAAAAGAGAGLGAGHGDGAADDWARCSPAAAARKRRSAAAAAAGRAPAPPARARRRDQVLHRMRQADPKRAKFCPECGTAQQ